uniref:Guanylate cyclase domain-containing protein n=1 Tax=Tetraselmis sp. GSL018 TaxID=582737 RepID=A0A061RNJ4_9CHLO
MQKSHRGRPSLSRAISRQQSRGSISGRSSFGTSGSTQGASNTLSGLVQRLGSDTTKALTRLPAHPLGDVENDPDGGEHAADAGAGLDALLRFVPWFVRERCLSGVKLDMLAENREVSILFVMGRFQTDDIGEEAIRRIQTCVTAMIDVANGEFGGVTRQVTVDDKGLAAIFVFGLAGFIGQSHSWQCLLAAKKLFSEVLLQQADLRFTAGLAAGWCYCGLVGSPDSRCEYAVMGDTVNTAARLAAAAADLNRVIVCSESMRDAIHADTGHGNLLIPAGTVRLKGKDGDSPIFVSDSLTRFMVAHRKSLAAVLVGRREELATLRNFIAPRTSMPHRILMLKGPSGIGKSLLLETVAQESSWAAVGEIQAAAQDFSFLLLSGLPPGHAEDPSAGGCGRRHE